MKLLYFCIMKRFIITFGGYFENFLASLTQKE